MSVRYRAHPQHVVLGQRVVEVLVEEQHCGSQQRPVVVIHLTLGHVSHLQTQHYVHPRLLVSNVKKLIKYLDATKT